MREVYSMETACGDCADALRGQGTQLEEDYGRSFNESEWMAVESLDGIAEALAQHCCEIINRDAGRVSREPLKYNEQWTLEKLIEKLQARV